jgi:hypothetical protein
MTRAEAKRRLEEIRQKVVDDRDEIHRLVEQGKLVEAGQKLTAYAGSVNIDQVYALALIAEGKEPLA